MKLKHILKVNQITWEWGAEGQQRIIKACEICTPIHSYGNWTGDPNKDYDETNEPLLDMLKPFIQNGHVRIMECDECCGCGDW